MKDREAVQNMIRLLRELNATLSFIKWELMLSTKPFIGWLVALFLFLLFSIFTCFTLSYSSHTLNHPFVFPCSYLHALASQSSWLSHASTSGNVSVSNAFQRARVSSPSPCYWKRLSPSHEGLVFQFLWPAVVSSNSTDGTWEVDLRREWGGRGVVVMATFRKAHCTALDF